MPLGESPEDKLQRRGYACSVTCEQAYTRLTLHKELTLSQILERSLTEDVPPHDAQSQYRSPSTQPITNHTKRGIRTFLLQIARFCMVGGLNTILDLLIFNSLLWLMPTKSTTTILVYNSIAYLFGGINSFLLNKYWTFRDRQKISITEVARFAVTTVLGVLCNDLLIWLISRYFHPIIADARLWANTSKILALCGSVLISYIGMRLWVFVQPHSHSQEHAHAKA
jgi:putative flippase GtrA